MPRPKGTPKTGGKTKGSQNKVTGKTREFFSLLLHEQHENIKTELENLKGRDYLDMILKLAAYVVPKPLPIDNETGQSELTKLAVFVTDSELEMPEDESE